MQQRKNRSTRLTAMVIPERYAITLKPDLKRFTFEGEETITLSVKKSTRRITLHSKKLHIKKATLTVDNVVVAPKNISLNREVETATFEFSRAVRPGKAALHIVFRGILNDRMRGFYRSRYEVRGETRFIATTQFEATDARRAFPCFDEPALKAVFEVTLVIPKTATAISNTIPAETLKQGRASKEVRFLPTPKMSTYLLAFIVGDFAHIEKKTRQGVLVRVFTTPGKTRQAQFALDCGIRMLSFFNTYFGIRYPLPKLDLIAIPDFESAAMENWGAITFREAEILLDTTHSSEVTKQRVALVIAHELSHQWFGNLVTMEWWTSLWLNEGFARYLEQVAVDHLFPKWNIWEQFVYEYFGAALQLDGLERTHPIETVVRNPNEINELFDEVSYSKGASIIRMLADYLGEKSFRRGLHSYLKKHSYSNASTEDLWDALEKASGKPIADMMAAWTKTPGYPLLTVTRKGARLRIGQTRFFSSRVVRTKTKDTALWHIPLRIAVDEKKNFRVFRLDKKYTTLRLDAKQWVKLNAGESSFTRVQYGEELMRALMNPVAAKELHAVDRLGLIRDAFALAESGEIGTTEALEFSKKYKKEIDYSVWAELALSLNKIHSLLSHEHYLPAYERFCRELFSPISRSLKWGVVRGEAHTRTLLRTVVLYALGFYGERAAVTHARKIFASITTRKNTAPPSLRGVIYSIVARHGGREEHKKLLSLYRHADLHEEKNRIGNALANFQNVTLLRKTLSFALSKEVRAQDATRIVVRVELNPAGRDVAWSFIKRRWPTLVKRYAGGHALPRLLAALGSFTTGKKAEEIRNFFKKNAAPGAERSIAQSLEKIYSNEAWLARDKKKIGSWFLSRSPSAASSRRNPQSSRI